MATLLKQPPTPTPTEAPDYETHSHWFQDSFNPAAWLGRPATDTGSDRRPTRHSPSPVSPLGALERAHTCASCLQDTAPKPRQRPGALRARCSQSDPPHRSRLQVTPEARDPSSTIRPDMCSSSMNQHGICTRHTWASLPTSKSQTTRTALTTDPLSIGILTITKRLALKAGITATDPSSTDILTITYSLALQANITGTDPSSMDIPTITKRQAGKSNLTAMALSDMDIQVITTI